VFMTGGAFEPEARDFLDGLSTPSVEKPFTRDAVVSALSTVARRTH
jgi:hypothetical protein